jgi:hypothetical protein
MSFREYFFTVLIAISILFSITASIILGSKNLVERSGIVGTIQNDYQITLDCGNYKSISNKDTYDANARKCIDVNNKKQGFYVFDADNNKTGDTMKIKVLMKDNNGTYSVFKQANDTAASDWVLMKK